MGKIECKKYSKAVWNFMSKVQQMQVSKLHEQQGIKPAVQMTSAKARISALEDQLKVNSKPKKKERLLPNWHGGETEGIPW